MATKFHSHVTGVCLAVFVAALATGAGSGLAAPPLKALVTDRSTLSLPTTLGLPPLDAVDPVTGDFAFTAGNGSGLFWLPAGSSTITRLLQAGDPVPGIADSQVDQIADVRINRNKKTICILVNFFVGDSTRSAIFTYSGSTFTQVALSSDTAPGSGGSVFGYPMTLAGFSDAGTVGFVAPLVPLGTPSSVPKTPTIFLAASGGSPVRVAGPGDAAPGLATPGGTFGALTAITVSNYDEVIFRAAITNGPGGFGLFAGSVSGVREVVANGDTNPQGGTFTFTSSSALSSASQVKANASGQIGFLDATSSNIFVSSVGVSPVAAVTAGTGLLSPLSGWSIASINGFAALSDSGAVMCVASLSKAPSSTTVALLAGTASGSTPSVVAYRGESPPGLSGYARWLLDGRHEHRGGRGLLRLADAILAEPRRTVRTSERCEPADHGGPRRDDDSR